MIHLGVKGDREILIDEMSRFGLTKSLNDDRTYDHIDEEAWDIESICFEDDKYIAVSHQDKSKHAILLNTLQVYGGNRSSGHVLTNGTFYVNDRDRISAYLLIGRLGPICGVPVDVIIRCKARVQ